MQVTTEKYNPIPMLWKPPPPSLYESLVMSFTAIYKIYKDPLAVVNRLEIDRRSQEMSRAARIYRVRPDVYLCDPRLFEEGLVD